MPRHQTNYYPSYGAMFKDAALYGLKKGLVVGGIAATALTLFKPELRDNLISLYATMIPLGVIVVTAVETLNAPLEHRVVRPSPQNRIGIDDKLHD